jgi:hypothetical protein
VALAPISKLIDWPVVLPPNDIGPLEFNVILFFRYFVAIEFPNDISYYGNKIICYCAIHLSIMIRYLLLHRCR